MITIKTVWVVWLSSVTWNLRAVYRAMAGLAESRQYGGISLFNALFDPLALILVGLLSLLLPPVAVISAPITLLCTPKGSWKEVRRMVEAGRVDLRTGNFKESQGE